MGGPGAVGGSAGELVSEVGHSHAQPAKVTRGDAEPPGAGGIPRNKRRAKDRVLGYAWRAVDAASARGWDTRQPAQEEKAPTPTPGSSPPKNPPPAPCPGMPPAHPRTPPPRTPVGAEKRAQAERWWRRSRRDTPPSPLPPSPWSDPTRVPRPLSCRACPRPTAAGSARAVPTPRADGACLFKGREGGGGRSHGAPRRAAWILNPLGQWGAAAGA